MHCSTWITLYIITRMKREIDCSILVQDEAILHGKFQSRYRFALKRLVQVWYCRQNYLYIWNEQRNEGKRWSENVQISTKIVHFGLQTPFFCYKFSRYIYLRYKLFNNNWYRCNLILHPQKVLELLLKFNVSMCRSVWMNKFRNYLSFAISSHALFVEQLKKSSENISIKAARNNFQLFDTLCVWRRSLYFYFTKAGTVLQNNIYFE